jgi:hypothetical protein
VPVPLRATVEVVPLAALLVMVTLPVSLPATVGSNLRSSVAVCDGDKVSGAVIPDNVNPVPLMVAALIVSAAVPLEVTVTVWVAGVFRLTLPKATLLDPRVSAAVPVLAAGLSCSEKLSELVLSDAVSVAVSAAATVEAVAEKLAVDAPEGTVTDAGTLTAVALLFRVTLNPLLPAASFRVTVQASVPAPVRDAAVQLSLLSWSVELCPLSPW